VISIFLLLRVFFRVANRIATTSPTSENIFLVRLRRSSSFHSFVCRVLPEFPETTAFDNHSIRHDKVWRFSYNLMLKAIKQNFPWLFISKIWTTLSTSTGSSEFQRYPVNEQAT